MLLQKSHFSLGYHGKTNANPQKASDNLSMKQSPMKQTFSKTNFIELPKKVNPTHLL
jgi:hypothetical protein